jgi:hypothetical protein
MDRRLTDRQQKAAKRRFQQAVVEKEMEILDAMAAERTISPRLGGEPIGQRKPCGHQVYATGAVARRMANALLHRRRDLISATPKRCEICGMIYIEELLG